MRRALCCLFLATIAACFVNRASAVVVYSENWDDLNGAARWSAPLVADEDPSLGFDGLVDYKFDYSVLGAPSAPHSTGGTTIGLRLETNRTVNISTSTDQGEGVGVVPLSPLANLPPDFFSLKLDAYSFVNVNGDGTTEWTTVGVFNHGPAAPSPVPVRFNISQGDGLAWSYTGEDGGSNNTNIVRFRNPPGSQTSLLDWEDIPPGSIPGVNTCHPGIDCSASTLLGPQNKWVEIEIKSVNKLISFIVNGYTITQWDNSDGTFSTGTFLLSESDPINSVSPSDPYKTMTVFDNVRLSVIPEPASWMLAAIGAAAMLAYRRRR